MSNSVSLYIDSDESLHLAHFGQNGVLLDETKVCDDGFDLSRINYLGLSN